MKFVQSSLNFLTGHGTIKSRKMKRMYNHIPYNYLSFISITVCCKLANFHYFLLLKLYHSLYDFAFNIIKLMWHQNLYRFPKCIIDKTHSRKHLHFKKQHQYNIILLFQPPDITPKTWTSLPLLNKCNMFQH